MTKTKEFIQTKFHEHPLRPIRQVEIRNYAHSHLATPPLKHIVYSRCRPQCVGISQLKLFNHPTYERTDLILTAPIFLGQNICEPLPQVDLSPVVTIPSVPLPSIVIDLKLGLGNIEPRFHRKVKYRHHARFIPVGSKVVGKRIEAVKENPIK